MKRKYLYLVLGLVFIGIQLFQIDKNNPPIVVEKDFLSDVPTFPLSNRIKDACYDCHSNTTVYPWYTSTQPLGWWIGAHIRNGRKKMNFSEWADYTSEEQRHLMEESVEVLEEMRMPLKSYVWLHPEAKLSDEERTQLIDFFKGLQ